MRRSRSRPHASIRLAAPLLALGVAACGLFGGGSPPDPAPAPPTFNLTRLFYHEDGGVRDSTARAIRDQIGYEAAWRQANEPFDDPAPPEPVNFARDMVILLGAGQMRVGDGIEAECAFLRNERTSAERDETERVLIVVVRTVRGTGEFAGDTYPVEIVRLPRFDGTVRFRSVEDEICPTSP